jgi:predicted MPP superfamily phosphohydrolase
MTRFYIVAGVFSMVLISIYYYIGNKFISENYGAGLNLTIRGISFALALLPPLFFILSLRTTSENLNRVYAYISFTILGFSGILFTIFLMYDILHSVFTGIESITTGKSKEGDLILRKDFFEILPYLVLFGFSVVLSGFGFFQAKKKLKIIEVEVEFTDLPSELHGMRIAQISDVHVGSTIKGDFIEEITKALNDIEADIIAITGDLVDGSVGMLKDHVGPLSELKSNLGTYFVTGNHEYYSGALSWIKHLETLGIKVLLNSHKVLEFNKRKFILAGVTDYKAHTIIPHHASDPESALNGAPKGLFKILLAHQPVSVFEASKAGFHLQLSGHTHGGQFFPGNILIHLFQKYVAGLYTHENTKLYVSRGTGYWGPPIRLGAPAEITILKLKKV